MNQDLPLIVNSNAVTEALGRDLTEDYSIVFSEQLKNAKDAGAKNVTIDISHLDKEIVITDDGQGTSFEDVKNTWLTVGTTTKTDDINSLGGKGIGRLTMFALGDTISVETTNSFKKSKFKLDKNELAYNKDINSKTIKVSQEADDKKQQTIIRITNVIVEYLDQNKIQKDLQNLFQNENEINFKILSESPETSSQDYISIADGTKYATLHSKFILDAKELSLKHQASVSLWDKSNDLTEITSKQINDYLSDNKDIFLNIGDIVFDVYHFYEPQGTKTPYSLAGQFSRKDIQNRLLSYAGGINIYRKGTKLFGYGLNDWLDLENESRNDSSKISNSRTLGIIVLSPESENFLVEKSNRESLKTTTKAYQIFRGFVELCIKHINNERLLVKSELLKLKTEIDNDSHNDDGKIRDPKSEDPKSEDPKSKDPKSEDADKSKNIDSGSSHSENDNHILKNGLSEPSARIEFKKPLVSVKIDQSYDLFLNLDRNNSCDYDGSSFSKQKLVYFVDGNENKDSYLLPCKLQTRKNITITNKSRNISNTFQVEILSEYQNFTTRESLFPTNEHNNHFKFESESPKNFLREFMDQLNDLWLNGHYDYVVTCSMRSIIDYQIEQLNQKVRQYESECVNAENLVPANMNGNFSDIQNLLDLIFNNRDLKKEIAELLGYTNSNTQNNLWRKFGNLADISKIGTSFKNKLQIAHTGAHKPQESINPMTISGLADDQKNFLELSSAYLKVLESHMSD